MPTIKRYPNRKLYDTEAKQYITLEGITALIRDGQEVQVTDHATGEDLTTVTLTQIIFEQEKKQGGFLPRPVLTGLVQAGGETLSALRRTLALPLDLLRHVDEEIDRRIQLLVKRGEVSEEDGRSWREKLLSAGGRGPAAPAISQEQLERVLAERGVPNQDDLQTLIRQLESVASKLEDLTDNAKPT
jgi:polyhydroxyalkanoate synthesis repressor PhaR